MPAPSGKTLDALLAEGKRLAAKRPGCHRTCSDLAAAVFIAKMHERGCDVSLASVEGCIQRMRIAVETGVYPDDLLAKAGEDIEVPPSKLQPSGEQNASGAAGR
jgi:hypothetical protein